MNHYEAQLGTHSCGVPGVFEPARRGKSLWQLPGQRVAAVVVTVDAQSRARVLPAAA